MYTGSQMHRLTRSREFSKSKLSVPAHWTYTSNDACGLSYTAGSYDAWQDHNVAE